MSSNSELSRTTKHDLGSVQKVVKVGLVGDGTVGKTTLLMTYTTQAFIKDYVPTVFDNFSVIEDLDGTLVNIILWDTAGQEDYVGVRKICYDRTDLFLVCFSLVHPNSFHNVKSKWLPELKQYAPNTPFVLIGTKEDLLKDATVTKQLKDMGEEAISKSVGQKFAKECGAEMFLSCSGCSVESVNKCFQEAFKWLVVRDNKKLSNDKKKWLKEAKEEEKLEKKMEKMALEGKAKADD